MHKILKAGLYFPKLFKEVHSYVLVDQQCQVFVEKKKLAPLLLIDVCIGKGFRQSRLDFIREIHPLSRYQHKWVLIATDYIIKWVEVIPTQNATDTMVIKFLEEYILARFGCLVKIVTDNAQAFKSTKFFNFC